METKKIAGAPLHWQY